MKFLKAFLEKLGQFWCDTEKKKFVGATARKQNNFKMKSEWFFLLFKYRFFNLAFFKMQLFSPCFSFLLTYYLCLCLFIICFYP